MKKKNKTVIFPRAKIVGKRNWGKEQLVALIPKKISLKLLKINKGSKGGLQYHHKKDECGYILSGKLQINYDSGNKILKKKILKKGDTFYFPQGAVHQEIALTDVTILEASTPYFNDRVRVEKLYGLKNEGGLKSTRKKDVYIR